jgi:PhnB protein
MAKSGKAKNARRPSRAARKKAAPRRVRPVPAGYHTATPYLTVRGAAEAIEFYKKAFGAKELMRLAVPGGALGHAEIRIGDSVVMLSDEFPNSPTRPPVTLGGTTGYVFLYVPDVDRTFAQAVAAGARVTMPLADMFWGDRFGTLLDPFGHAWGLATHKEDVPPREIARRAHAAMAGAGEAKA